jgi:transposase
MSENRTVKDLAALHGICPSTIYAWVRQARVDAGDGPPDAPKSGELEELRRLRKEVRVLRQERDFLAVAAKYFAADKKP